MTDAPTRPRNGLGTSGFIFGLLGAVFAFIPLVGVIAWPLVVLGLIFSVLGYTRTRSGKADNKGLCIAGAALSIFGLVVCIVWAAAFNRAVHNSTGPPSDRASISATMGQPVRDGNFEFTVTSISHSKSIGTSPIGATAQGEYAILHVTVRNIGNEAQTLSDSSQFVRDAQGHKYSADSVAGMYLNQQGNSVLQSINPGNTLTGQIAFDMPRGSIPLTSELHDSPFSGGVTVNLR